MNVFNEPLYNVGKGVFILIMPCIVATRIRYIKCWAGGRPIYIVDYNDMAMFETNLYTDFNAACMAIIQQLKSI